MLRRKPAFEPAFFLVFLVRSWRRGRKRAQACPVKRHAPLHPFRAIQESNDLRIWRRP